MDTGKERQKDILLQMHRFYGEEARDQRSMMWSDEVTKQLEPKKKGLLFITQVTQREALIKGELGLLTLAAIIQAICIYLY